jgi:hypothetical protein
MLPFILRRLGVMLLTMLSLSFVVFFFVNLDPNLRKLAIFQTEMRASDQDLENWLQHNGYRDNFFVRFGRWVGVWQKVPVVDPATGKPWPGSGSAPSRRRPASRACWRATSAVPLPSARRSRSDCPKRSRRRAS